MDDDFSDTSSDFDSSSDDASDSSFDDSSADFDDSGADFDDTSSATTVKYMQQAVHNILYTYIDTVYRTETATGFDISHQIGQRSENLNGTWWRTVLTVADIVIAVGLLAWATLSVLFTWVIKRRRF